MICDDRVARWVTLSTFISLCSPVAGQCFFWASRPPVVHSCSEITECRLCGLVALMTQSSLIHRLSLNSYIPMYRPIMATILLLLLWRVSSAQATHVSGYVKDEVSGEPLVGASVHDIARGRGTSTNSHGFFAWQCPSGTACSITFSYVGYRDTSLVFDSASNAPVTVMLAPASELPLVEVRAAPAPLTTHGAIHIPVGKLRALPALGGEVDLLKALALMPGVSTGVEGSSALHVRGGTPDQNLILMDGATIYKPSHLFGFLSAFNPAAVKDVRLIKSGFPAQYGGRLSSVIDITTREGDKQRLRKEGAIGTITSNFLLEGPISRGRSSFMVTGRAAYAGLLSLASRLAFSSGRNDRYFTFFIYDLNAKAHFELSERGQLFVSLYAGSDDIGTRARELGRDTRYVLSTGNQSATVRYTHILGRGLFARAMLVYSRFAHTFDVDSRQIEGGRLQFNQLSGMEEATARVSLDWSGHRSHTLQMGAEASTHRFRPSTVNIRVDGSSGTDVPNVYAPMVRPASMALFVNDEVRVGKRLTLNLGLRATAYLVEGRNYPSLEPRLSASYGLGRLGGNLQASYTLMQQPVHQLVSNTGGMRNEYLVAATPVAPPQRSWQWAASYARQWSGMGLEVQVEVFHKSMLNQIDLLQGANPLLRPGRPWEESVQLGGTGEAYGLEVFARKQGNGWETWLSYTLSRNQRRFDGINGGRWYPHQYDRRHDLALVYEGTLNKRWSMTANFVFATGHAVTMPEALHVRLGDMPFLQTVYPVRNNQRMPPHHRLDVAFHKTYRTRRGHEARWSYSIYNAYARRNAMALGYFNGQVQRVSYLMFIPGISYSVKFK